MILGPPMELPKDWTSIQLALPKPEELGTTENTEKRNGHFHKHIVHTSSFKKPKRDIKPEPQENEAHSPAPEISFSTSSPQDLSSPLVQPISEDLKYEPLVDNDELFTTVTPDVHVKTEVTSDPNTSPPSSSPTLNNVLSPQESGANPRSHDTVEHDITAIDGDIFLLL